MSSKANYEKLGIYVHVPFCAKPCGYCRFYKKTPTGGDIAEYIEYIGREAEYLRARNEIPPADTMFWGGGTPSILSPSEIGRLAEALEGFLPSEEWTVEISPSTATKEKLAAIKAAGATRVSLGAQSFDAATLACLGRAHTLRQTLDAVELAQNANFKHFSLDLIFGARGQTPEQFESDMRAAAAAGADHISAYCLEFESGTSACGGAAADPEKNSLDADLFCAAMRVLPELGFAQYEISNYARGVESRCLHNVCTWQMARWLGLGPSAASQFGGRRYRNAPSLARWMRGLKISSPDLEDIVPLDDAEMFSCALIFGLRMNEGVDLRLLKSRFPKADAEKYAPILEELARENFVKLEGSRASLTERGRLCADAVAVELL